MQSSVMLPALRITSCKWQIVNLDENAGFQSVRNTTPRPTTKIDTALDIDDEQRILEPRDAAMFVLSLFYWMLTKREA